MSGNTLWEFGRAQCSVPLEFADSGDESTSGIYVDDYDFSNIHTPECNPKYEDVNQTPTDPTEALWSTIHSSSFEGFPAPPNEYMNKPVIVADRRRKFQNSFIFDSQHDSIPCPPKRARKASRNSPEKHNSTSLTQSTTSIGTFSIFSHSFKELKTTFSQVTSQGSMKNFTSVEETFDADFDYSDKYICCEEVSKETYRLLHQREISRGAIEKNFLQQHVYSLPAIATLRHSAILRIHDTVKKQNFHLETLHLAVYYLDAALSVMIPRNGETMFKMTAVALVLASKMEEYSGLVFSSVAKGGTNSITNSTMRELAELEVPILTALDWRLDVATSYTMANYLHTLVKSSFEQIELTNYLLLLALFEEHSRRWTSTQMSHAAVIISHALRTTSKTKYYSVTALLNLVYIRLSEVTELESCPLLSTCQFLFGIFKKIYSTGGMLNGLPTPKFPYSIRFSQEKLTGLEKALQHNFTPPLTFDFLTDHQIDGSTSLNCLKSASDNDQEEMDETGDLMENYTANTDSFPESFDFSIDV